MKRTESRLLRAGVAIVAAVAVALSMVARVSAADHHLRVIVGLATIDARATWWTADQLRPPGTGLDYRCDTATSGNWWHCDDGAGRPALDLNKGDGTVSESFGGCVVEQSVNGLCGTKVFFQAFNIAPSAPLIAKVTDHSSPSGCMGVSVQLYTPVDLLNSIARFEFVHMDNFAVGQNFFVVDNWTIFELGRVKSPDCISTGPHLHQSGGPEGSVVTKNSALTAGCTDGAQCFFSPTGDYNNKSMHDVFWKFRDHKLDANGDGYSDADENTPANCGVSSCYSLITFGAHESPTCKDAFAQCGVPNPPANENVSARTAPPPATGYGCSVTLDTVGKLKTTYLAMSDFDLDGVVSIIDVGIVANWYLNTINASPSDPRWEGNLDGDGVISIIDIGFMADNYLRHVANKCLIE